MPYTLGFDPILLPRHYADHGPDFAAATAADYERLADQFLGGPPTDATRESRRVNGDFVRYNEVTEEFGILSAANVIRTYYKPDPAIHGFPSNLHYFWAECLR